MELSVVLLFLAGCSLSWAKPILVQGLHKNLNSHVSEKDNRTMLEIMTAANKDITHSLVKGDIKTKHRRSAKLCPTCMWPKSSDGKVRIPYVIAPEYSDYEVSYFNLTMKEFETTTCLEFVKRTNEEDYFSLESGNGCWSYLGKVGGKQTISVAMPSCIKYSLIQHEFMHMLGFYHEVTRNDRDQYINIYWQNIDQKNHGLFDLDNGDTFNLPYDYNSVMHYSSSDYSIVPGQPSVLAKSDPKMSIGQQIGMTNIDVMKVNIAYNCNLCRKKFLESGTFTFTSANQEASSCLYLIQSSAKVLLQLSDVNIPSSPDCKDTYIKVYDGVSKSSPVFLDKTCGKVSLPPLVSSEDHLLIEIVNNKPSAEITFKASYNSARFGKTHVTDNGAVMSPLFPGIYPRNVDAFYSIIAPKGYKVSLNIDFFWMTSSSDCTEEYLIIRESMTSPILATYCGYLYPIPPMVSSGNTLILQFHSSPSPYRNGFHAFYNFVPSS